MKDYTSEEFANMTSTDVRRFVQMLTYIFDKKHCTDLPYSSTEFTVYQIDSQSI